MVVVVVVRGVARVCGPAAVAAAAALAGLLLRPRTHSSSAAATDVVAARPRADGAHHDAVLDVRVDAVERPGGGADGAHAHARRWVGQRHRDLLLLLLLLLLCLGLCCSSEVHGRRRGAARPGLSRGVELEFAFELHHLVRRARRPSLQLQPLLLLVGAPALAARGRRGAQGGLLGERGRGRGCCCGFLELLGVPGQQLPQLGHQLGPEGLGDLPQRGHGKELALVQRLAAAGAFLLGCLAVAVGQEAPDAVAAAARQGALKTCTAWCRRIARTVESQDLELLPPLTRCADTA